MYGHWNTFLALFSLCKEREGDLIIIPPRWWHQVYHCEPSIAVAGQYANDNVKEGMFEHIMRWCSGKGLSSEERKNLPEMSGEEQVQAVIRNALIRKHGDDEGLILFDKLYPI